MLEIGNIDMIFLRYSDIMKGMIHMEIIRKTNYKKFWSLLRWKPYGKFLITGVAGSGKTALLNIAGKNIRRTWKEN